MSKFVKLAVSAALLSASLAATAVTTNIGTLPVAPATFATVISHTPGSFTDFFNFTLPSSAQVSATADNLVIGGFSTSGLTLGLYFGANGTGSLIAVGSPNLANVPLVAGSYSFVVQGTATGAAGGLYSFVASSASPVPEPQTYALMLAGVAAVGFVAGRRQRG